jgi:glycosyltransferase involved in cell wall biosynthesis
MGYRRRLAAFGQFAMLAAKRSVRVDPDLVFATSPPLTVALPAIYAARRLHVPMVFEARDLWPEMAIAMGALRRQASRRAAWWLERQAYEHSAGIVALSRAIAHSIQSRFPHIPVTVVPNGCDLELFAEADLAGHRLRTTNPWLGDNPLILYAGTLGPANGLDYVVRMAATLLTIQPNVRIALVGRGREEASLRQLAGELGVIGRNLDFFDHVPKEDVVGLFGACDLAMATVVDHPSLQMDSSNKIFDAFAAGRPAAINHEGELAERLRTTGAGLVLPPTDPVKAASIVADFLDDAPRVAEARVAAARLAREDFNRNLLFERFEDALLRAAGRSIRGCTPPAQVPVSSPERIALDDSAPDPGLTESQLHGNS